MLKKNVAVKPDTTLRLPVFLQTSPEFRLNLQTAYDLKVADALEG